MFFQINLTKSNQFYEPPNSGPFIYFAVMNLSIVPSLGLNCSFPDDDLESVQYGLFYSATIPDFIHRPIVSISLGLMILNTFESIPRCYP